MPKLVFIGAHFAGRVYDLMVEKTTVGRAVHNTLTIHDNSVSSHHCEILVNGPEVIVHDLASANGTFVDDVRVNKQCQVKSGHILRFGSVEARLELEPETSTDHATDLTAHYALEQFERDQRRKKTTPEPATISATIEANPESLSGEHTVMMPRPPAPVEAPQRPVSEPSRDPNQKRRNLKVILIVAVVLGVLPVLYWLLWGRK